MTLSALTAATHPRRADRPDARLCQRCQRPCQVPVTVHFGIVTERVCMGCLGSLRQAGMRVVVRG